MKKNTVKAFVCFLLPISMFSQNNWKTTGNSGTFPDPITATSFLGTTNGFPLNLKTTLNQPMNFFTNNVQRMTITPTGLVGIGVPAPASQLHVNSGVTGNLFRTTGPSTSTNVWRLETTLGITPEKFSIFVLANSNNAFLRTNVSDVNSPGNFLLRTGGDVNRFKLNGTYGGAFPQYSIGAYDGTTGVNTSGYMLLSSIPASALYGNNNGAWSLLHLDGQGGSSPNAYRPWMQTGLTYTAGGDMAYSGYRVLQADRTEMTLAWSNDGNNNFGPDDMVFRFLGFANTANANTVNANNTLANDLDGRHVARFTPIGNFGIGPNFGWQFDDTYIAPTHRIDVEGNGRFRNVPDRVRNDYLIFGQFPDVNGDNVTEETSANDIELSKLLMPNNPNVFLNGNGVFSALPPASTGTVTANNGLTMSTPTNVQLGGDLIKNTTVNQAGFNMVFSNVGSFGVGSATGDSKFTVFNTNDNFGNPYLNVLRLLSTSNVLLHNITENGQQYSEATKKIQGSHNSFNFLTKIENNSPNGDIRGVHNAISGSVPSAHFIGYSTSFFNQLGDNTGLEINIRGPQDQLFSGTSHICT